MPRAAGGALVIHAINVYDNKGARIEVNPATSFDVFFSYHWRDHAPVEAVARALTERGLRVFLDRWYLDAWTAVAAGSGAHARILQFRRRFPRRRRPWALAAAGEGPGARPAGTGARLPGHPRAADARRSGAGVSQAQHLGRFVSERCGRSRARHPLCSHSRAAACCRWSATDRRRQSGDLPLPRLAPVPRGGRRLLLRPRGIHREAGRGGRTDLPGCRRGRVRQSASRRWCAPV